MKFKKKKYGQSVEINHYPNSPYLPNHTYRILIIVDSESGKTSVLLNLIKNQRPYTDNIYSNVKDLFESKYQLFVDRREKVGIKKLKNSKAFIDYSETINNVYENLEDYNPIKKRKALIVYDDMVTDMESNKKSSHVVTELF